jgi:hypothetical protein
MMMGIAMSVQDERKWVMIAIELAKLQLAMRLRAQHGPGRGVL